MRPGVGAGRQTDYAQYIKATRRIGHILTFEGARRKLILFIKESGNSVHLPDLI